MPHAYKLSYFDIRGCVRDMYWSNPLRHLRWSTFTWSRGSTRPALTTCLQAGRVRPLPVRPGRCGLWGPPVR